MIKWLKEGGEVRNKDNVVTEIVVRKKEVIEKEVKPLRKKKSENKSLGVPVKGEVVSKGLDPISKSDEAPELKGTANLKKKFEENRKKMVKKESDNTRIEVKKIQRQKEEIEKSL